MSRALGVSWLSAVIAVLGSLYFSEVLHFVPCTLCWYQRILMYPLAVILGIAVYKRDHTVYRYALPLSLLGIMISAYHYSLQKLSFMQEFQVCTGGVPCSGQYINLLGFITIPFLALIAFTIISACLLKLKRK
ncbi:disulfide oxidoreductase [Peribacillus sp. SCS-37]|uniref:disulfide oxidoreductase n=1 Tax=Paraperibacillus esterisolvens TaxID=3115296 RepID=UPI003906560E